MIRQLGLIACGMMIAYGAFADEVYKWQDDRGMFHYSSKPPHQGAQPADLPPIMRAEVKVDHIEMISCDKHGGVDCTSGADTDGSVICQDGFTNASQRYRFTCNSPKLSITEITEVAKDGTFSVFVRNSKSVPATSPALFIKPETGQELKLNGPEEIEAFGVAEFKMDPAQAKEAKIGKPVLEMLRLTCANCPG